MPDPAATLAALLKPYADPTPGQAGRLVDVLPDVGERALQLLLPDQRTGMPNGVQPPMAWLVAQARDLGGRLVGSLTHGRAYVRFDGVQVPAAAAVALAARVARDWPRTAKRQAALSIATAEAWTGWEASTACWVGTGTAVRTGAVPTSATVVGLWWD